VSSDVSSSDPIGKRRSASNNINYYGVEIQKGNTRMSARTAYENIKILCTIGYCCLEIYGRE